MKKILSLIITFLIIANVFVPIYALDTFTVNFYTNANKDVLFTSQQVNEGEYPIKPSTNPASFEDGGYRYEFNGWYWTINNATVAYDFESEICAIWGDTDLYAGYTQYLAEGYELIVVHSNGGEFIEDTTTPITTILKNYTGITTVYTRSKSEYEHRIDDPDHKHSTEYIPSKEATCVSEGNIAYYYCPGCYKYFSDKDGNNEISKDSITIKALGHKPVKLEAKKATCSSTGLTEGSKCSVCNEILKAQEIMPTLPHSYDEGYILKEATEYSTGIKVYTCKVCKATMEVVLPSLSHKHTVRHIEAKEATCLKDGNIEYYICDDCGLIFKDKDLKYSILKESTIIEALGHKPSTKYSYDDNYHYHECENCNERLDEELHDFDGGLVTKEATKKKFGEITYTCKICNYKKTEVIGKLNNFWLLFSKRTYKASSLTNKEKKFSIIKFFGKGSTDYILDDTAKEVGITVTSKGKVTIPKNCPKGTYTIEVRMNGNDTYQSISKYQTIIVK